MNDENIGKVYHYLTIKSFSHKKGTHRHYNCECICGNSNVVRLNDLRSGNTKSCGCYKSKTTSERVSTHGMSKTKLYRRWKDMRRRCNNPNRKGYKNYGGRGIKVCEEWEEDFMNFYNWSMENGYLEELEIDRIDNDGNYEPNNCRWITRKEQSNNKQQSRYVTINGITKTLKDWSAESGLPYDTLRLRLNRGWKEKELLIPLMTNQFSKEEYLNSIQQQ